MLSQLDSKYNGKLRCVRLLIPEGSNFQQSLRDYVKPINAIGNYKCFIKNYLV